MLTGELPQAAQDRIQWANAVSASVVSGIGVATCLAAVPQVLAWFQIQHHWLHTLICLPLGMVLVGGALAVYAYRRWIQPQFVITWFAWDGNELRYRVAEQPEVSVSAADIGALKEWAIQGKYDRKVYGWTIAIAGQGRLLLRKETTQGSELAAAFAQRAPLT